MQVNEKSGQVIGVGSVMGDTCIRAESFVGITVAADNGGKGDVSENAYSATRTPMMKAQAIIRRLRDAEAKAKLFRRGFIWQWDNVQMRCVCIDEKSGYGLRVYEPIEAKTTLSGQIPFPCTQATCSYSISNDVDITQNVTCVRKLVGKLRDQSDRHGYFLWNEKVTCPEETGFMTQEGHYTIQITDEDGRTVILRCVSSNRDMAEFLYTALCESEAGSTDAAALFEDLQATLGATCRFGMLIPN